MKKTTTYLILIISIIINTRCNYINQHSLKGKKLYILTKGKTGGTGEIELDFESENQVKLKLTCLYFPTRIARHSVNELSFLKQVFSRLNGTYPYIFKNNVLTIPNTTFVNLKLIKNDEFFIDSKGQLYNYMSILKLKKIDKINRLKQVNNDYWGSIENDILPTEITLDSLTN